MEGHILLVQQQSGGKAFWTLPGGTLQAGETPAEAAFRALDEQTGIDAGCAGLLLTTPRRTGDGTYWCFEGEVGGVFEPTRGSAEDLLDVAWVPLREASRIPEIERILPLLDES
jgi:8-oxo-dGTP diphosphatase